MQVLFNQSLRYNISYGKQEASDAEIFAAARSAALGNLIEGLPEGLDTVVGERGVRLSGGERQRVGCARCIIKAPTIVLLDEASSALVSFSKIHVRPFVRTNECDLQELTAKLYIFLAIHRILKPNVKCKTISEKSARVEQL